MFIFGEWNMNCDKQYAGTDYMTSLSDLPEKIVQFIFKCWKVNYVNVVTPVLPILVEISDMISVIAETVVSLYDMCPLVGLKLITTFTINWFAMTILMLSTTSWFHPANGKSQAFRSWNMWLAVFATTRNCFLWKDSICWRQKYVRKNIMRVKTAGICCYMCYGV